MSRNMIPTIHIENKLKSIYMYTCSSQVLLLYHEVFKLGKYVKVCHFVVIFGKPSELRFKARYILIRNHLYCNKIHKVLFTLKCE